MNELEKLREDIEQIDRRILELLAKRLGVAHRIGKTKKDHGLAVFDESRESELKVKWKLWAKKMKLDEEFVLLILGEILRMSKKVQKEPMK